MQLIVTSLGINGPPLVWAPHGTSFKEVCCRRWPSEVNIQPVGIKSCPEITVAVSSFKFKVFVAFSHSSLLEILANPILSHVPESNMANVSEYGTNRSFLVRECYLYN